MSEYFIALSVVYLRVSLMFRAIEQSYVEPVPRKRLTARNDAPEVDIEIKIDIVNTRVIE